MDLVVVVFRSQKKQTRVSLNSSSQYLVSGGLDNAVHIWDLKTKRLHRSLKVMFPPLALPQL